MSLCVHRNMSVSCQIDRTSINNEFTVYVQLYDTTTSRNGRVLRCDAKQMKADETTRARVRYTYTY